MKFNQVVKSIEELHSIAGTPGITVLNKTISFLDEHCRNFMDQSPFVFISTSDSTGRCDCSPRGDAPGFVHVLDEKHLVIPERPGNRKMDSLINILSNPNIGLIFVIPGLGETLRINGSATIIQDAEILEKMAVNEKVPQLGIVVKVEECYIHCAKAFKRSQLWEPESWSTKEQLPQPAKMLAAHINMEDLDSEKIQTSLDLSYKHNLY
ncbi:pyridoxamine 5'-phosphate oxidase family protein [Cytobacillus gottheilii]|uniref:Pyridoxamine 5'-phosphate oxidase family protein n=1 Tax=Cytobacillus gottheilii TaxID=859144 RepID=A0ABX8FHV8_9BACI|nr:pyridoxamine 5'-phosphate oxidase family protein [Cytobacillus gottheilii]